MQPLKRKSALNSKVYRNADPEV